MAKIKYYAVRKGRVPGIYTDWNKTKLQVEGFTGAEHKSFLVKEEADNYLAGINSSAQKTSANKIISTLVGHVKYPSISVDAACSGNPGILEYRGVDNATGKELFRMGPFLEGTNNIGEYLALVHGISYLLKNGSEVHLYTDSLTGLAWLKKGKNNSTLKIEPNSELHRLVKRADEVSTSLYNKYKDKIIKWDTKSWGEIPADFGRK